MTVVKKPWGYEEWIVYGDLPYAFKRIFFNAGKRTSLQAHQFKTETNYILNGFGKLYKSKDIFDVSTFLKSGMSEIEIYEYESTLDVVELFPGATFNILPGIVHRVQATTDLEFFEVSTPELDDVVRLQDDMGRTHGKIQNEHE